jgi:hypothetical protein
VVANTVKGVVLGFNLAYAGGKANELIAVSDNVTHQAIIGAVLGAIIGLIPIVFLD